jgi:hypothetical protein
MTTIYKILAEVKILHEYYLTDADGKSIFSLGLIADRKQFLQDFYLKGQKGIHSDISFSFSPESIYKEYHLKLLPTYSGFKIGVEVNRKLSGGQVAFTPVIDLPAGTLINVLVKGVDSRIKSFTNSRIQGLINASYFFTNDLSGLSSPFLSQPINNEDTTYPYEQGELAVVLGNVSSFYYDTNNQQQWKKEAGMNYSSEKDRSLLPVNFIYQCDLSDNLTQVTFTLQDSANQVVFQQTKTSGGDPFQTIDVSVPPTLMTFPSVTDLSKAWYKLSVTGNGGFSRSYQVIFQNAPEYNDLFALITFNCATSNTAFTLIDNNGLLITRYNNNNTVAVSHPVFEIWLKSKSVFWNYINDEGGVLKNLYNTLLSPSSNGLQTLIPEHLTILPQPVGTKRLPNPVKESMIKQQGSQKILDILVPFSDQFPKGP